MSSVFKRAYVAQWGGEIIGEAASEREALVLFEAGAVIVGYYDAEDGPGVQGYEADGRGVWIIDGELRV